MIYRLKEMMMEIIKIENRGAALISQGDQSQKEYRRVTDEKDRYKAEAESANQKLQTLEEEATKLRASEKAIKQQAENQAKECILIIKRKKERKKEKEREERNKKRMQCICAHVGV